VKGRVALIFLFKLLISTPCYSQGDDFGIWYGLNAGIPVAKKIDFGVSAVVRTFNNASKIDQAYLEGGLSYKFNKYLSISGSYRLIDNSDKTSGFHIRHKWFSDIKSTYAVGKVSFSARLRFQIQTKTFIEKASDKIPEYYGRIKLKGLYKIPDFPLNPYLCFETFSQMFSSTDMFVDKKRFTAGFEYKISKVHSIETEYIFERDYLPNLADLHIVSVSYSLKF
jgi:long-subunit fatty acid transport protein